MFEFSIGTMVIIVFVLIWFWNSVYVIKEWERGVVLRLGRLLPEAKGAGVRLVFWPIETLHAHQHANRNARRAAARHHHARQRLGKSKRRLLFPRRRREPRGLASAKLSRTPLHSSRKPPSAASSASSSSTKFFPSATK